MGCVLILLFIICPVQEVQPLVQYDNFHAVLERSVGENGFSFEATWLTACTVYNRQSKGYGEIPHILEAAYYAPDKPYSAEMEEYVKKRMPECDNDILYALSYNDIVYLGFPIEADIVSGSDVCRTYGDRSLRNQCAYFYSKWQR